MTIDVRKNDEMSELILCSLRNKKIDIRDIKNIKAYFDAVTKVISYTAVNKDQTVKGEIYI